MCCAEQWLNDQRVTLIALFCTNFPKLFLYTISSFFMTKTRSSNVNSAASSLALCCYCMTFDHVLYGSKVKCTVNVKHNFWGRFLI